MYCISDQQIDYILNDIRRRGVEMEDLQLNLLDHICCIAEQNLKEGEDFEAFYKNTIPTFFRNELWEIEQETITLLTFKHYYAMKKTMIISGAISVAALLFGSLFKIMHWPGASVLLLLGIATLSLLFLPLMLTLRLRETPTTRDKLVAGLGTMVGILLCLSTLFKIMHWPGAGALWITTSACSIFLFIPVYFFTGIKKPELKLNTIVTSIILVGATGLLFSLTSIRASWTIERTTFLANQDLAATLKYATEQNRLRYEKALTDSMAIKKNKALKEKCEQTNAQIHGLIVSLVNYTEGSHLKEVDFSKMWNGDFGNYDIPTNYFFVPGQDIAEKPMMELRKVADDFNAFIKTTYNKEPFGMMNTAPSVNDETGQSVPWEITNFFRVPYGVVLRNLTQMEVEVRTVEAACIQ